MKTTKAKTSATSSKSSDETKTTKKKKTASAKVKYEPTEDEIREKAREIYYERIARGEQGTAEDDWHEAEELLKGS